MRTKLLLSIIAALCAWTAPANAISWSVQLNCSSDYYAYCSKHVAGSAGCHACMRANRPKLSAACVSALIDDGVLAKSEPIQSKAKLAMTRLRPAKTSRPMPTTKPSANTSGVKAVAVNRASRAAAAGKAIAAASARRQRLLRLANLQTQRRAKAAKGLAIAQETLDALRNRPPYFLSSSDYEATASIAAR